MGKKVRKFADGGSDRYKERQTGARNLRGLEGADKPLVDPKGLSDADIASIARIKRAALPATPGEGGFGAAFKAARAAGDKNFTWRGKSYTTDMASDKKPATRASTPARPTADKPTARADKGKTSQITSTGSVPRLLSAATREDKGKTSRITSTGSVPRLLGAATRADKGKTSQITSTGSVPRLLGASTPGTTAPKRPLFGRDGAVAGTRSEATRAAKLAGLAKEASARGASTSAKDRYRMAKETNMYAKGGKIDGCAVRGKTKGRKK